MNPNYIEFNALANFDDGSCATPVIYGCTIDYALNYNALANSDDGSCENEKLYEKCWYLIKLS